jgi:hypothetical protein
MTDFTSTTLATVAIPVKEVEDKTDYYDYIERYEEQGYKTYRGFKYHLNFPDEWILDELPQTGRECWNCVGRPGCSQQGYAMWRGLILGYCMNCVREYNGERGCGFLGFGVERGHCHVSYIGDNAYDTYLKGEYLDDMGDVSAYPEDTLENHFQLIKQEEPNLPEDDEDDDCDIFSEDEYFCRYCEIPLSEEVEDDTCKYCREKDEDLWTDEYDQHQYDEEEEEDDGEYAKIIHGEYVELEKDDCCKITDLRFGDKIKLLK